MFPEIFTKVAISKAMSAIWDFIIGLFKPKPLPLEEIKRRTHVLFVDDESFDSLLDNIRQAGWSATQTKDILNLDSDDIRKSDVIFVDYKGVGQILTPTEEGIGLLKALKQKYPQKYIIFYSGYAGVIPGDKLHGIADGWIRKNSDPYVYIERIESAAKKIYAR